MIETWLLGTLPQSPAEALQTRLGAPQESGSVPQDLYNPIVLENVNQLRVAKRLRQIVFASHNANLVVNGDAKLVAWFLDTGLRAINRTVGSRALGRSTCLWHEKRSNRCFG